MIILGLFCFTFIPFGVRAENHGGIKSIELAPLEPSVRSGENLTFTLTAKDNADTAWDITASATFSIDDPRGSLENNLYQAGKVGIWTVSALYGNLTAETKVNVSPGDPARIQINPNTQPEIVILGEKKTFTAQAFDKMNNPLESLVFAWSQEGNLGSLDQSGVFIANDTGEGQIVASLGQISGSVEIKAKEKTILPQTAALIVNQAAPANLNTSESQVTEETAETGTIAGAETVQAAEATENVDECKAFAWYWWVLIMLGFFAVLILYYFFIRKVKGGWWWIFPLIFTAGIVWLYYQYACNKYGWWPWVTIIIAILITLFRPKKYFEEPKSPTF